MADSYQTVNGVSALNTVAVNEVAVKGELLSGDLVTGFRPVLLGGEVKAGLAARALIVDAHIATMALTADGRVITAPGSPTDRLPGPPVVAVNTTSVTDLVPAKASPVKIAVTAIEVMNLSATGTQVIISCPSLGELCRFYIGPTSGRTVGPWRAPIETGPAEALRYQLGTAVGASVLFFTPFGYITRE